MITDRETNILYLSSLLKSEFAQFWADLKLILDRHSIKYRWIEHTKSIWCRDYMPVQVSKNEYIQFKYFPDYYIDYKYIGSLTLQYELEYKKPGNLSFEMDMLVDGGNIVRSEHKVIMTEKVFKDNSNRRQDIVTKKLKKTLGVDKIYFIPTEPRDITGHSDGMVRFLDENTLLVNEFTGSLSWMNKLNRSLKMADLKRIPFPYIPSEQKKNGAYTAHGCYINYAQIGNLILFPQFGGQYTAADKTAVKKIKEYYPAPKYTVEPINADSIAWDGGVLNCCTWNVSVPVIERAIDKILPVYKLGDTVILILEEDYKF